jgi:hypothetical protein
MATVVPAGAGLFADPIEKAPVRVPAAPGWRPEVAATVAKHIPSNLRRPRREVIITAACLLTFLSAMGGKPTLLAPAFTGSLDQ